MPTDYRIVDVTPYALAAAGRGWPVFPLKPHDKVPITEHGLNDATTDPVQLGLWFDPPKGKRRLNYGVVTGPASGLYVVDIDEGLGSTGAKHGRENWSSLLADLGHEAPTTLAVLTPSGGMHLYFRHPEGEPLPNTAGRIAPDIDTRGAGGYVVGPGSAIGEAGYDLVQPVQPIAEMPEWLIDLVRKPAAKRAKPPASVLKQAANTARPVLENSADPFDDPSPEFEGTFAGEESARARVEALAAELAAAPDGQGNDTASRLAFMAGQYVGAGQITSGMAADILHAAIDDWSWSKPGDAERMRNTIDRQLAAGSGEPRAWLDPTEALIAEAAAPPSWFDQGIAELEELSGADRMAAARALAARSWELPAAAAQDLRDRVGALSGLSRSDWNALAREAARAARRPAAPGEMPAPTDPLAVARAVCGPVEASKLRWWRGDWYRWLGASWQIVPDRWVRERVALRLESATYADENGQQRPWAPSPRRVAEVVASMADVVLARDEDAEPDSARAFSNGHLLDPASPSASSFVPADPSRFVVDELPFAYDAEATAPRWEKFVAEIMPADEAELLQEWFGYVVTGRADLHKILSLAGPPRAGKSLTTAVLSALVGHERVAAPSLAALAAPHGESALIGKSLAVFGEANWRLRDAGTAVEALKGISGQDRRSIPRKYREAWVGVLPARIMIVGNEPPAFPDEAAALAGRLMHIQLSHSWSGREDPTLLDQLLAELPGILQWSLAGAARLAERGRFDPPASSREALEDMTRTGSTVAAFIEDRCIVAANARVALPDLFLAYQAWCEVGAVRNPLNLVWFARALRTVAGGQLAVKRVRVDGDLTRVVEGANLLALPVHDPFSNPA